MPDLINERYSVLSLIAEGPTGKLFRCRDARTESAVTLKLLTGGSEVNHAEVRRLREELSVTRALSGKRPNVAVVYDCDLTVDGRVLVVMEPLEGRSLLELLRQREPLPVERAVRVAFQIAEGLHAAHDVGLVHGSLTAEHVLVEGLNTVKVVGFEVARLRRASSESTRPVSSGGANGPRPSERTEVLTEAADTHAVGLVLLETLQSGPQGGGTISPAVKQLVMRALARSPGAPQQEMDALARTLSRELGRRPEPSASRAWRRARARPRRDRGSLIWGGALALVIGALVGWLAWSLVAAPRRPVPTVIHVTPVREGIPPPPSSVPDPTLQPSPSNSVVGSPPSPPVVTSVNASTPELPAATTTSPPGKGVVPRVPRVGTQPPKGPALNPTRSAGADAVPARPQEPGRRAAPSGSARLDPEAPDPSAIIEWLIKEKGDPLAPR